MTKWDQVQALLDGACGQARATDDQPSAIVAIARAVEILADAVKQLDDQHDLCTSRAGWALMDAGDNILAYSCTEHLPHMAGEMKGVAKSIQAVKDIVQLGCQYSGGE